MGRPLGCRAAMGKPVFGPMVRAVMIAGTALFALYRAATLGHDSARDYPWASTQTGAWVAVWAIALGYTALAAWIAYRVVRERFPPAGVSVVPALALNPFGETVMSVTGGLLLLLTPLILLDVPLMRAELAHVIARRVAAGSSLEEAR